MALRVGALLLGVAALANASPMDIQCTDDTTANDVVKSRDLSGQTHVITGGDSGIGYYTALALASKNATVVLGLRGKTGKYATAVDNITRITGNHKVFIVEIDLSKFSTVRSFAAEVRTRFPVINTLICNAGIMIVPPSLPVVTEDGFEMIFQVNYLSHALLVEELLPVLRQSHSRVIEVASSASFGPCLWADLPSNCTDLSEVPKVARMHGYSGNNSVFVPRANYGFTKYMQIFHAAELARREDQITAYSLHPGIVESPLLDQLSASALKSWCSGPSAGSHCPLTSAQGAATSAFIASALAEDEALKSGNGKYFTHCTPNATDAIGLWKATHKSSSELEYQKALFDMTLKFLKITEQDTLIV
jgi:NAD(P)-dependent dehydrogenase (short-subunit alcohol dehydrogenase family)